MEFTGRGKIVSFRGVVIVFICFEMACVLNLHHPIKPNAGKALDESFAEFIYKSLLIHSYFDTSPTHAGAGEHRQFYVYFQMSSPNGIFF